MEDLAMKKSWWKHREVWLLALGPIIVVIAGFVTYGIAYNTPDSIVANDAYRKGQPSAASGSMTPANAARNHSATNVAPRGETKPQQ